MKSLGVAWTNPFKGLGELLPRLAQPHWYRLAHSGRWTPEKSAPEMSPEARKVYNRKSRKADRRMSAARARDLATLAAV